MIPAILRLVIEFRLFLLTMLGVTVLAMLLIMTFTENKYFNSVKLATFNDVDLFSGRTVGISNKKGSFLSFSLMQMSSKRLTEEITLKCPKLDIFRTTKKISARFRDSGLVVNFFSQEQLTKNAANQKAMVCTKHVYLTLIKEYLERLDASIEGLSGRDSIFYQDYEQLISVEKQLALQNLDSYQNSLFTLETRVQSQMLRNNFIVLLLSISIVCVFFMFHADRVKKLLTLKT